MKEGGFRLEYKYRLQVLSGIIHNNFKAVQATYILSFFCCNQKRQPKRLFAVLQNERHCGDILARKTWTPSYLDHKARKNVSAKRKYYSTDDHPAIISRDDFIATQRLIANSKYGHKGLLPSSWWHLMIQKRRLPVMSRR